MRKELTGKAAFSGLVLSLRGRAFVFLKASEEAFIAVRAGASSGPLTEVERLCNYNGRHQTDLTQYVKGLEEITVELEFHPLGLTGWAGVFEMSFDLPWEAEHLLKCNRSYAPERLRQENLLVGWRAEAFWALRHCEKMEPKVPRERTAAVRQLMEACDYRKAYELAAALLLKHREDTHYRWEPPPPHREENGLIAGHEANAVIFSPYEEGFQGRRVPLAQGAVATLVLNGKKQPLLGLETVAPGDDVHLVIENNKAVKVTVSRNTAQGKVLEAPPATAFDLPMIQLEGTEKLPINSCARIVDRTGEEQKGRCPLVTGKVLFEPGDIVSIRWNPLTMRVMEAVFVK